MRSDVPFLTVTSPSGIPCRVALKAPAHHDIATSHDDEHVEETDELAPDEPRTPGWLTALGGALFLAAIVWLVAS